jgi:transposase
MNSHQQLARFAGFDWAKDHHDVVVLDARGRIVDEFRFEHSIAGWNLWRQKVAGQPGLGVAVETSFGAAVEQLLASGVTVYPVNPMNAKRYRERKCSSGNKMDRHDAWALADALRVDGHAWRPLAAQDPLVAELRILCRDEVALIGERTALVNQLQQALHEYYPTALESFDDWTNPGAWAFVEAFPSTGELVKAGKRKWDKFLHSHKLYRSQTYQDRIAAFERAAQWHASPPTVAAKSLYAVARCKQLRVLQAQLAAYRQRIETLFASHPDSGMFGSLPGAGPKIAPRLLGEIGSDRALYHDPQGLQCMAGTAPVSFQSGQIHKVKIRRACNKHLRHTMHLFADHSRAKCVWAATYYGAQRQRGKTHAQALRCLGQRWLKIIWKMWQTHTNYDPELHARNQTAHGSWVLSFKPE